LPNEAKVGNFPERIKSLCINDLHSHPTGKSKKCWLDGLALPQGRDEK
jgi:hypothetical protein